MTVPKKVRERVASALKQLVPIIEQQKARDVSEADTVTLVKDLLSEAFGYDKWAEITGQFAIRGRFCDLAIRLDEKVTQLIEVKAIGITLDERHLRQVVDYAANQGIEWVMLTNGIVWRVYNVTFGKPIDKRLVAEFDVTQLDLKRTADQELVYVFTKEGFKHGVHVALRDRQDATSRHLIAALLLHNDRVLDTIRRELRRVVNVNVDEAEIAAVLSEQVIKRDALEDPGAKEAIARVNRKEGRSLIKKRRKAEEGSPDAESSNENSPISESG